LFAAADELIQPGDTVHVQVRLKTPLTGGHYATRDSQSDKQRLTRVSERVFEVSEKESLLAMTCPMFNSSILPVRVAAGERVAFVERITEAIIQTASTLSTTTTPATGQQEPTRHDLEHLGNDERVNMLRVLVEFDDVFYHQGTALRATDLTQHRIRLQPNASPVFTPQYPLPHAKLEAAKEIVRDMLRDRIAEPAQSPCNSPVLIVTKANGDKRFVTDFRRLNHVTVPDRFPMARVDNIFNDLRGMKFYTTMDLKSGFWQILIAEEDRYLTAFSIPGIGQFQYIRLPFGLSNSPATFCRVVTTAISGHENLNSNGACVSIARAYVDDLLIASRDYHHHLEHIRTILTDLRRARLTVNPVKCSWLRSSTKFLGHILTADGVSIDPARVKRVAEWSVPTNRKALQRFIGFVTYCHHFIQNFATICKPLYDLSKRRSREDYVWLPVHQQAFDQMRLALGDATKLAVPYFDGRPFVITSDASNFGIGAVLEQQQDDGTLKPIAFAGRNLKDHEKLFGIAEKECLALVYALTEFKCYTEGFNVTANTDHSALTWLRTKVRLNNRRLQLWALTIQASMPNIVYVPGRDLTVADALSRCTQVDDPELYLAQEGAPHTHAAVGTITADSRNGAPTSNDMEPSDDDREDDEDDGRSDTMSTTEEDKETDPTDYIAYQENGERYEGDSSHHLPVESSSAGEYMVDINVLSAVQEGLRTAQRLDRNLTGIIRYLEDRELPDDRRERDRIMQEAPEYFLRERLLHRGLRLVIPTDLQLTYLSEAHGSRLGGHMGEHRTLDRLSHCFWKGMTRDAKAHVKACTSCCLRKPKPPRIKPQLVTTLPDPYQPFTEVNIDMVVGLPTTTRGNTCILTVTDKMSRWVEAYPLPNSTAGTVATVLACEFIARYGCPIRIVSDRGSNFTSDLLRQVIRVLNIQQQFSPAYCPWINGSVERMNGSIIRMLSNYVNEHRDNWDIELPFVLFAYRAARNRMTGYSPFQLVYGTEARVPSHLSLFTDPADIPVGSPMDTTTYITRLSEVLRRAWMHAAVRDTEYRTPTPTPTSASASQRTTAATSSDMTAEYQVGDNVWVYQPSKVGGSAKFAVGWAGPFVVSTVLSEHRLLVKRGDGSHRWDVREVHGARVKPYRSPIAPTSVPEVPLAAALSPEAVTRTDDPSTESVVSRTSRPLRVEDRSTENVATRATGPATMGSEIRATGSATMGSEIRATGSATMGSATRATRPATMGSATRATRPATMGSVTRAATRPSHSLQKARSGHPSELTVDRIIDESTDAIGSTMFTVRWLLYPSQPDTLEPEQFFVKKGVKSTVLLRWQNSQRRR